MNFVVSPWHAADDREMRNLKAPVSWDIAKLLEIIIQVVTAFHFSLPWVKFILVQKAFASFLDCQMFCSVESNGTEEQTSKRWQSTLHET